MAAQADPIALPGGYKLHQYTSLDSTNAEALRAGTPHGYVFLAGEQSAGRGRQGRDWVSPAGNLHVTLCVDAPSNRYPAQLAFVAGLGVLDTIGEIAPNVLLSLKWPNDVLARGKKLSGMLIETADGAGYAVGIGINLATSPADAGLRYPATSLTAETGGTYDPVEVAGLLCHRFDDWYRRWDADGFEPLRAVWLASAHMIGDTIAASTGTGRIEGRFDGLDENGALVLEDAGGESHVIAAGDVIFPGTD